ncbi:MAG: class I SAM-dependent methyltransferase [Spirochaetales bacterium]|nr:class I SAM-dependent methyltransferase [Spirochaetales bacterium]
MSVSGIYDHYKDNFGKALTNDKILDWESRDAQEIRFSILKDFILANNLTDITLLDVGCGLADLYDYLVRFDIRSGYTGIDILPEMISLAKQQHPDLQLIAGDIFADDLLPDRFDVVYSSGIFNIDLGNNYDFLRNAVKRFMSLSKRYVVFNLLADTSLDKEAGYFYFNKQRVETLLSECKITDYKIITGYLHNDMSVVINS